MLRIIVVMATSADDPEIVREAKEAAELTGDIVVEFEPNCFKKILNLIEEKKIDKSCFENVLLFGHASPTVFGEGERLIPSGLLRKLIKYKFPFHLVKEIGLLGCDLGLLKEGQSYTLDFANLVFKLKEAQHICLRTITNLSVPHDLYHLEIKNAPNEIRIFGIPANKEAFFKKECDELKRQYEIMDLCIEKLTAQIEKKIDPYILTITNKEFLKIIELAKQNKESTEQLQEKLHKAYRYEWLKIKNKYLTECVTWDQPWWDTLKSSDNFLFTKDWVEKFNHFTDPQWKAWGIANDQIETEKSSFYFSRQKKENKLRKLEELRAVILNSPPEKLLENIRQFRPTDDIQSKVIKKIMSEFKKMKYIKVESTSLIAGLLDMKLARPDSPTASPIHSVSAGSLSASPLSQSAVSLSEPMHSPRGDGSHVSEPASSPISNSAGSSDSRADLPASQLTGSHVKQKDSDEPQSSLELR